VCSPSRPAAAAAAPRRVSSSRLGTARESIRWSRRPPGRNLSRRRASSAGRSPLIAERPARRPSGPRRSRRRGERGAVRDGHGFRCLTPAGRPLGAPYPWGWPPGPNRAIQLVLGRRRPCAGGGRVTGHGAHRIAHRAEVGRSNQRGPRRGVDQVALSGTGTISPRPSTEDGETKKWIGLTKSKHTTKTPFFFPPAPRHKGDFPSFHELEVAAPALRSWAGPLHRLHVAAPSPPARGQHVRVARRDCAARPMAACSCRCASARACGTASSASRPLDLAADLGVVVPVGAGPSARGTPVVASNARAPGYDQLLPRLRSEKSKL